MRKVKVLVASVLFCATGYAGYTTYEKMTMSGAEKFMKTNIGALTRGEISGAVTHELDCGKGTIKMCEAICGICQVTLKVWGAHPINLLVVDKF